MFLYIVHVLLKFGDAPRKYLLLKLIAKQHSFRLQAV